MTTNSIAAVARREMRDTLSDWRMLVPVLILTFVVPLVFQSALLLFVRYFAVDGAQTVYRLVPFAVLLCGFLPASFSLISALESFVGEKERNTLESLLAMPMSDSELYLGKLAAALLSPLLSALLAMLTLIGLLLLRAPEFIIGQITPWFLLEIIVLVACKATVMVAGAVIISSHTTTTRAANLLASFVLIPMAVLVQAEAFLIIGNRPDALFWIMITLIVVALMLVRSGMSSFNREEILGREHAGFSLRRTGWAIGRFWSGYQPAGVGPERYTTAFSLGRWYRREFPALLRDYRIPLAIGALGAVIGALGGFMAFSTGQFWRLGQDVRSMGLLSTPNPLAAARSFGLNSQGSLFATLIAPFSFGVPSLLLPAGRMAQLGYMLGWGTTHNIPIGGFVARTILPTLLIELPALILAAATALRIGASVLRTPKGFSVGQNMLWSFIQGIKVWLLVLVPLFATAAFVERILLPWLF